MRVVNGTISPWRWVPKEVVFFSLFEALKTKKGITKTVSFQYVKYPLVGCSSSILTV